jgi:low temperature requirement protein LtrA
MSHQSNTPSTAMSQKSWLKPMLPRSASDPHRVATPLELLFDLVFVVAIAVAGAQLHHGLAEHHFSQIIPLYLMVFFAIWWAWMNFTWFASAYDNDDVLYRIVTFVQMIGSLVIASGVTQAFKQHDFSIMILGYVIMRIGSVFQWVRAGLSDPTHRKTAFRYATGILIVQVGWILYQFVPHAWGILGFAVLVACELSVPVIAEKASLTPWHPHHISERYGLLTIIVLGESILAGFNAMQSAIQNDRLSYELVSLMIGGMIIMFGIWWSYFDREAHHLLTDLKSAVFWGYGHFFIFLSIAAIGAGLAVAVDVITGHADINHVLAGYSIAIPLSLYSVIIWIIHDLKVYRGWQKCLHPLSVLFILALPLLGHVGYTTLAIGVFYAICLILRPTIFKQSK